MTEFISHSVTDTEKFAKEFAKKLKSGDVLALNGEMGAGKTAFVRGLAEGLSLTGEVCSPTYSIINEYGGEIPLFHFDMYRIVDADSVYSTGFFDYLDMDGIVVVEWSENILWAMPEDTITVLIEKLSEDERKLSYWV